jgi:anti-anti-sigma factor
MKMIDRRPPISPELPPEARIAIERRAGSTNGRRGDVCIIRVEGALDLATAEALRPHCDGEALRGCQLLIVDLCRADFLDSEGIKLLFQLRVRLLEQEGDLLVLVPEGSYLLRTLELTGCWRLIPILKTLGEPLPLLLRGYGFAKHEPDLTSPERGIL